MSGFGGSFEIWIKSKFAVKAAYYPIFKENKLKLIDFNSRYHLGTPMPNIHGPKGETCSFVIYANSKKFGEIMTPTYPGTYPKNMHCSYKFIGEPNQRMRLEFRDFDLFYGGAQ